MLLSPGPSPLFASFCRWMTSGCRLCPFFVFPGVVLFLLLARVARLFSAPYIPPRTFSVLRLCVLCPLALRRSSISSSFSCMSYPASLVQSTSVFLLPRLKWMWFGAVFLLGFKTGYSAGLYALFCVPPVAGFFFHPTFDSSLIVSPSQALSFSFLGAFTLFEHLCKQILFPLAAFLLV